MIKALPASALPVIILHAPDRAGDFPPICTITTQQIDFLFQTFSEHPSFLYRALADALESVEYTLSEVTMNDPGCPEIQAYTWIVEVRRFLKKPLANLPSSEQWETLYKADLAQLKHMFTHFLSDQGIRVQITKPKIEPPKPSEQDRLFAFFKSSSHDPGSPWFPKNRGES